MNGITINGKFYELIDGNCCDCELGDYCNHCYNRASVVPCQVFKDFGGLIFKAKTDEGRTD